MNIQFNFRNEPKTTYLRDINVGDLFYFRGDYKNRMEYVFVKITPTTFLRLKDFQIFGESNYSEDPILKVNGTLTLDIPEGY